MRPPPLPPSLEWRGDAHGALFVLDQTRLPRDRSILELRSEAAVADAILRLCVRGAPAIGIAAAYGLYLGVRGAAPAPERLLETARQCAARLLATRPTAVNLRWALDRGLARLRREPSAAALLAEAHAIHAEDRESCARMGRFGAPLIQPGERILTHCNAGRLATGGDGTALAVLFEAHRQGVPFSVFADETRPLLQGARLTALELAAEGIPCEILPDSAAAGLIARGLVQRIFVGADRIASNGDFANKVGTYGLALAAQAHQVPFHVVAPWSTVDLRTPDGAAIPIEERNPMEVLTLAGTALAAEGIAARNPAFDVTPRRLVTSYVTDQGVLLPPFQSAVKAGVPAGR